MDTIISFIAIIIIFTLGIWAVDGCYKINEEEKKKEGKNMSKKIYKGYELIKAITDGEIKEGSRFKVKALWNGSYITYNRIAIVKYKEIAYEEEEIISSWTIINSEFELIEDETIDIESINELLVEQLKNREHTNADIYAIAEQQNKILQVLKQQEKRIKKLEEK